MKMYSILKALINFIQNVEKLDKSVPGIFWEVDRNIQKLCRMKSDILFSSRPPEIFSLPFAPLGLIFSTTNNYLGDGAPLRPLKLKYFVEIFKRRG